jgi:hypothetical protein
MVVIDFELDEALWRVAPRPPLVLPNENKISFEVVLCVEVLVVVVDGR